LDPRRRSGHRRIAIAAIRSRLLRANQLRLWFASFAYVLICALRRIGLAHTQFADATCGTIRLKLFKIGALVQVSVRRIRFALASAVRLRGEPRNFLARARRSSLMLTPGCDQAAF
jgi:hypothetical protein